MKHLTKLIVCALAVGVSWAGNAKAADEGFKWNADVAFGYLSNMNKGASGAPLVPVAAMKPTYYAYGEHDTFSLDYVDLQVTKTTGDLTGTIQMTGGLAGVAAKGDEASKELIFEQAYVTYKCPTTGILLDVGKWNTPLGNEVLKPSDNWNYTRSLGWTLLLPFWHTGVRVTYPVNDMFSIAAFAVNGWNNLHETNKTKDLGATIVVKPNDMWSVTANYLSGNDLPTTGAPAIGAMEQQTVYDVVVAFKAMENLNLAADYESYGGKFTSELDNLTATSLAIYAKYDINDKWSVAPRYEMFSDAGKKAGVTPSVAGTMTAAQLASVDGQKINSLTLTLQHNCAKNAQARIEYRTDTSDQKVFFDKDSKASDNQATLSVGMMASF